jgi:hypothetical protein
MAGCYLLRERWDDFVLEALQLAGGVSNACTVEIDWHQYCNNYCLHIPSDSLKAYNMLTYDEDYLMRYAGRLK